MAEGGIHEEMEGVEPMVHHDLRKERKEGKKQRQEKGHYSTMCKRLQVLCEGLLLYHMKLVLP